VEEKKYLLAIDFGNTNIKAAVYDPTKGLKSNQSEFARVVPLKLSKGQDIVLPNIAHITKEKTIIGNGNGLDDATHVQGVKSHLTKDNWEIFVQQRNSTMNAVEIMAEELEWTYQTAKKQCMADFEKVIITVPVCFSEVQKLRVRKAAEKIPCPHVVIATEPFAGLFSCWQIFETAQNPFHALVFDIGGGTLDMCVFHIQPGKPSEVTVLASKGITFAGNEITQVLYDTYLQPILEPVITKQSQNELNIRFLQNPNIPAQDKMPDSENYSRAENTFLKDVRQKWMSEVNLFKEYICYAAEDPDEAVSFSENFYDTDLTQDVSVSYQQFEEMLEQSGIRQQIQQAVEDMLEPDLILKEEIQKIIMIGGTSRIPYFQKVLKDVLEIPEEKQRDYFLQLEDEAKFNAVSVGAAVFLCNPEGAFRVKERPAYEIGMVKENRYESFRSMYQGICDPTNYEPVLPEIHPDGGLVLKMYQLFEDTHLFRNADKTPEEFAKEAVYMGCFHLPSSDFEAGREYFMSLCTDKDGFLFANFCEDATNTNPKQIYLTMEV